MDERDAELIALRAQVAELRRIVKDLQVRVAEQGARTGPQWYTVPWRTKARLFDPLP